VPHLRASAAASARGKEKLPGYWAAFLILQPYLLITKGYDTNDDTNCAESIVQVPHVIENLVSAAGFEPAPHALKGLLERIAWVRQ